MTACTKCGAEGHLLGAPENAGAVLTGATGAALCVYDRECDLRAELRDLKAERDALRRELDTALAAEIKLAGQACQLRAAVLRGGEDMGR